jgi:hypothetical protein
MISMQKTSGRRAPVLTRTEQTRLAFLTSTHVIDDLYQGAACRGHGSGARRPPPVAAEPRAAFPAIACVLTFLLRDPRPRSGRNRPPDLAG